MSELTVLDSLLSKLPSSWSRPAIANVARLINGRGFKPHEWDTDGLPIIRIQNLNGSTDFNYYSGSYVPKIEVNTGDLLFAWSGSRGTSFGPHFWNGPKGVLNYHTWRVKVDESAIAPDFFYHALRFLTRIIEDRAHGASALVHVQKWEMEKFGFPCPNDRAEQQAIAAALSDADGVVARLERVIAKKRLIKQGAMQDLLTARRRLPGFSGEWEPVNLARESHLKARIGWQGLTTNEYRDSGEYHLITGTEIIDGRVDWRRCVFVDKWRFDQDRNIQLRNGDVLLTKDGTIGKVAQVRDLPGPAALNSGVFVIRPRSDAYDSTFLFHILRSSVFDTFLAKLTAGSTIVHLYQKDLVTFEFLAPDIAEQRAIAEALDDMDIEIQTLESRLAKARAVKEGMMQNLLTGRVRLV